MTVDKKSKSTSKWDIGRQICVWRIIHHRCAPVENRQEEGTREIAKWDIRVRVQTLCKQICGSM